ncbi:MAG TPA: hypothetical protein VGO21_03910 [Candidatus Paceibacterota bacterium]|nr:hypothetical protein [Candidatus Paceibacterota bacterium]
MNTLMQSQIFFFISSVGFVFLWVLVAIFLFYLIRATSTFSRIMAKLEKDIDTIGDTTKDFLEDIQDSFIYRLLFKKKKKHSK